MLFLCVNVYCHRVTTQLQLINIIIITNRDRYINIGYEPVNIFFKILTF